jgi:serine phosphatase RsbU (regulator of sigma subunit)
MKRRTLVWLGIGAALAITWALAGSLAPESSLTEVATALTALWVVVSVVVGCWLLWRWLTYRVSVRLLLSYVLIGVSPFLFCAMFGGFVLYLLMGQYTSVRLGTEMDGVVRVLDRDCERVLEAYQRTDLEGATALLEDLAERRYPPVPRVSWVARLGGELLASDPAQDLPDLHWLTESNSGSVARQAGTAYVLSVVTDREGRDMVAALIPLDVEAARAMSAEMWFDVYFMSLRDAEEDGGEREGERRLTVSAGGDTRTFTVEDDSAPLDEVWDEWPESEKGLLWKPWVYWFRATEDVRDLATGKSDGSFVTLLRTSPANVWQSFILWRYELGSELWAALGALGTFFLVVYGLAVLLAATMMISITRSTSRLTRGAREVQDGNLDHRISVKRHDQLGDLALSFNRMTESIQDMMIQVADRERLARELELAREIQESLLPDRHLRHGQLTVHATFRPATEVGGDYFDIFPLGGGRLVVVVGDVAGHGLHTGLIMASLKSSVATLIQEGYGGEELLRRVNQLLVGDGSGRTMATLTAVEIDPNAGQLQVTAAGHPPAYLLSGGSSEELMTSSLPVGSQLFDPVRVERTLPSECLLVLYSDGLVEATDASGEPFGYERLARLLAESPQVGGGELAASVLEALDHHVGDRQLDDDLTLVVVENACGADST